MFIPKIILYCLDGPLRGHARSHNVTTNLATCTVPVGAGMPAKGPAQATSKQALQRHLPSQRVALNNPNSGINRLRAYRPDHCFGHDRPRPGRPENHRNGTKAVGWYCRNGLHERARN
ncbi:hypothetical protein GEV39_23085 [Pseudomonas sp. NY5710]|nr:hypothetical protein GEV39_23085 [Pseudomonas sp. NY5710]